METGYLGVAARSAAVRIKVVQEQTVLLADVLDRPAILSNGTQQKEAIARPLTGWVRACASQLRAHLHGLLGQEVGH